MWLLQVLLALLAMLLTRCVWRRWRYDLHKIPTPPGLPLMGQTLDLFRTGLEGQYCWLLGHWQKSTGYPKLMRISLLGHDALYLRDTECFKTVILSKQAPMKNTLAEDSFMRILLGKISAGKVLLGIAGHTSYVKSIRQVYATAFQSRSLKTSFDKLNSVMDVMMAQIETKREKGPVEFQELCVRMTLDAIGAVAMGANLGGLDGSRDIYRLMIEASHIAMKRGYNPFMMLQCKLFPNSESVKQQDQTIAVLHAEWDRLAGETLEREDPPAGEEPIWYGLKRAIDPDTGEPISRRLLAYELGTLVLAGMDPSGHQLAWTIAAIASHPRVAQKLLDELTMRGLYGTNARGVTFEDLGELSYLTAVIKESMRMVSVVSESFGREAPRDMTLMGYRIPKGTKIVCPGNRWANSVEEWGDPDVFRPERWLTGEDMSQKYYLGFSHGYRDCAGQKLAMMEMRLAIIRLMQQYALSLTIPFEQLMMESYQGFSVEAGKGMWIHVVPRDNA